MLKIFKKILFLIFVCTLFISFVSAEEKKSGAYSGAKTATHPGWFKESFLDLEEDVTGASDENKRLVVYFWQPGCPYCNQLWEENFSKKEIVKKFRDNFEIVAINMWGDREVVSVAGNDYTEKSFAEALRISYTPTLLFFDENRKVVHQLNGYTPPKNFQLSLDYVAGKHEKEQNYGSYSESIQKNIQRKDSGKLHTEDFFTEAVYQLNNKLDRKSDYLAIYFETGNCVNCDLLHNKTLKDPVTRELAGSFDAVQLDRYSDMPVITPNGKSTTAKDWGNRLNISYLPAVIFFDASGKEVMRIDTQMRTFHFQSVFDYVLSGAYKTELNFQRYISARADKIREKGIDVDIFAY